MEALRSDIGDRIANGGSATLVKHRLRTRVSYRVGGRPRQHAIAPMEEDDQQFRHSHQAQMVTDESDEATTMIQPHLPSLEQRNTHYLHISLRHPGVGTAWRRVSIPWHIRNPHWYFFFSEQGDKGPTSVGVIAADTARRALWATVAPSGSGQLRSSQLHIFIFVLTVPNDGWASITSASPSDLVTHAAQSV